VSVEAHRSFACFGGLATIHVRGATRGAGERAAALAQETLLDAHRRLSRFEPESELSRLNRDPREEVPASPLLRALAAAVAIAGAESGGLVDATLLDEIERAGYRRSLRGRPPAPAGAAPVLAERAPARPNPAARWRAVGVDEAAGTIVRPPGLRIDGGGLAKGLLADLLASELAAQRSFAVDCCGDVHIGGSAGLRRRVLIDDPAGAAPIHELALRRGAIATSGIGRRRWTGSGGRTAHHVLDPATGDPACTGLVQATALAPSALLAEVRAKAALLSGPAGAAAWLPDGGVVVGEGGEVEIVAPTRGGVGVEAAA
jgi:thiamine biosynthesis lipoprotein